jgi:hypothetical protein
LHLIALHVTLLRKRQKGGKYKHTVGDEALRGICTAVPELDAAGAT